MEGFALILTIPLSFVLSSVYSILSIKFIKPHTKLSAFILWPSFVVIYSLILETILVIALGPNGLEKLLGSSYFQIHLGIFILSVPSFVTILALQKKFPEFSKWYIISSVCVPLALYVLLLQYHVTDTLFEIQ